MRLKILRAEVSGGYGAPVYLPEEDIEIIEQCPACTDSVGQRAVSIAEGVEGRGLELSRCDGCTHIYLSRRPSQDWFQRYYASEWDSGRLAESSRPGQKLKELLAGSPRIRRAGGATRVLRTGFVRQVSLRLREARILSMLAGIGESGDIEQIRDPGKLLEIGCGYGAALMTFREAGFDVYGTEASERRAAFCRRRGLRVEQTGILDFDAVSHHGPFDIVYSAHVFEHLTDLDMLMARLKPLVKPDGVIYIEVPHSHVAEHILHRTHVPVHCHLFSATSLARLLHRFGFQVARVLADVNLHMVAMNRGGPDDFPAIEMGTSPESLTKGLAIAYQEHGPINYDYDHYHIEITRVDGGALLYERPPVYGTSRLTSANAERLVNRFVVQREQEAHDEIWPIRFAHPTQRPPMWLKRQ